MEKKELESVLKSSGIKSLKGYYDFNDLAYFAREKITRPKIKRQFISMLTEKGGVGKTSVSYNLGYYLALRGYKILFFDLDGQCNLTTQCLGNEYEFDMSDPNGSVYNLLLEKQSFEEVKVSISENVDLIPGYSFVGQLDIELSKKLGREFILKKIIQKYKIDQMYDFIFFDNHSAPSLASNSTFYLSGLVISVVMPDRFSLSGIAPIFDSIEDSNQIEGVNNEHKILINNLEVNNKSQISIYKEMASMYKDKFFNTFIKRSNDFNNSSLNGLPFFSIGMVKSNAIRDMIDLVNEFEDTVSENEDTRELSLDNKESSLEENHGIA